jgi:hypothetical protein
MSLLKDEFPEVRLNIISKLEAVNKGMHASPLSYQIILSHVRNPVILIRGVLSHDLGRIVRNVAQNDVIICSLKRMIVLHFYGGLFSTTRQRTDRQTDKQSRTGEGRKGFRNHLIASQWSCSTILIQSPHPTRGERELTILLCLVRPCSYRH